MGEAVQVIDASGNVSERTLRSQKIQIIRVKDFLPVNLPFLGFGVPNVFLAIPHEVESGAGLAKVAAKSLYRGDTTVEDTRGLVQSGLAAVFTNLWQAKIDEIYEIAKRHEGSRAPTCVNANCRILAEAGFTIGGESLANYYFPVPLLRAILKYGLEVDGQKVEFEFVRTTPGFLENVGFRINKAVITTFCRHAERSCAPIIAKVKAGARKALAVVWTSDDGPPSVVRKPKVLEAKPILYSGDTSQLKTFNVAVTEPSTLGTVLRTLWGPHILYEVEVDPQIIAEHLPRVLTPFPQENPSLATRLKKNILFSKSMVRFIRSQMAQGVRQFQGMNEADLYNMIRTDSPESPNRYNMVVTSHSVIFTKIGISNEQVDWILSKHLIADGYSGENHYSSEIWKDEEGYLNINRNSGTFQPYDEENDAAVVVARILFPHLPIRRGL